MVKKIILGIVAVLAVVLVGVLIVAATKPDTFQVQRETTIQAPPEKIFALVDDFHKWQSWSPYEKLDPAMKKTFSGPESGKGAAYEWSGNSQAGAGRMEIAEAVPASKVTIKLDFSKPIEGHNMADFTIEPKGDGTRVVWAMRGPSPYLMKVFGTFVNLDTLIGKDFEAGLANLKNLAEKP